MPDDREITVLCAKGDSSEYVAGPLSHGQRGVIYSTITTMCAQANASTPPAD